MSYQPKKIKKKLFWNFSTKYIDTKRIMCYNVGTIKNKGE